MAKGKKKRRGGKKKGSGVKNEKCQVGCAANNVVTGGGRPGRKKRGRKVGGQLPGLTQTRGLSGGMQEMPKEFITFR